MTKGMVDCLTSRLLQSHSTKFLTVYNRHGYCTLSPVALANITKDLKDRYVDILRLNRDGLQAFLSRNYPTFSHRDYQEIINQIMPEKPSSMPIPPVYVSTDMSSLVSQTQTRTQPFFRSVPQQAAMPLGHRPAETSSPASLLEQVITEYSSGSQSQHLLKMIACAAGVHNTVEFDRQKAEDVMMMLVPFFFPKSYPAT
jgi:hypothetical protein